MTLNREDILISRIVDGSTDPGDWDELQAIAEDDPAVLRRLAESQRRESALRAQLQDAIAAADDFELPGEHAETVFAFRSRLRAWAGWSAAALIALAWLTAGGLIRPATSGQNIAGWSPPASADEAFERYQLLGYSQGRVLGELPLVMIQSERLENGQDQVVYMRRILEQRTVTEIYEPGVDESGNPTLVPAMILRPSEDAADAL